MSTESSNRVSVTDVNMPFVSMVRFMVKWAVASIPALLILTILGVGFWIAALGIVSGIGSRLLAKSAASHSSPSVPATVPSSVPESATLPASPSVDAEIAAYLPNLTVRKIQVAKNVLDQDGVWGEVKNDGDRTLKEVELTIYCLDSKGKPIFEKTTSPVRVTDFAIGDNKPLKPGYSRQFGIRMDDAPSEWSKKVEVKVTAIKFEK